MSSAEELYDQFLAAPWPADFRTHMRPDDAELECVIVEPRAHPRLVGVLRNMSAVFPYAALTIFCSSANESMVREAIGADGPTNVRIFVTIPAEGFTRNDYGRLLMTPEFWDQLVCEKILIFQTDSGVLHNAILRFMQYDYIGAPWPWRPLGMSVGNGGFSLRSRSWMQYISRHFTLSPDAPEASEDLFFCHHLRNAWDAKLPSPEVAASFAVEYSALPDDPRGGGPMGFHQFYLYHDPSYVATLLNASTAILSESHELPDIKDAWIQTSRCRYYHPRLVPWLKMGITRVNSLCHFNIAQGTVIPFAHDIAPCEPKTLVVQFTEGTYHSTVLT